MLNNNLFVSLYFKDSSSVLCRHTVCGLSPATSYRFRVSAENEIGIGKASVPSDVLVTKDDRLLISSYDQMVDAVNEFKTYSPTVSIS